MIRLLTSIFGGGLAEQLRLAYQARLNAQTDSEKLAVEREIARLEGISAERARSSGFWEIRLVAFVAAFPAAAHAGAIAFVSTFPSIGWTVQAMPPVYADMQLKIILSLFGIAAIGRVLK
jgi:hypothetical protein